MRNKEFTKVQPTNGEFCLHCGHLDHDTQFHFWMINGGFVRPDGSVGRAKWLIACDPCFRMAKGDATRILVRGDATWLGDEPIVMKADNPFATQH